MSRLGYDNETEQESEPYDEFWLTVDKDGSFEAALVNAQTGPSRRPAETQKGKVALTPLERRRLEYDIKRLRHGDLDGDSEGMQLLGEALYNALFSSIHEFFLRAVRSAKESSQAPLRLFLRVDPESEVMRWPLEFLRCAEIGYLATDHWITLARQISYGRQRVPASRHPPPLRVLVIVSRPPKLGPVMANALQSIGNWAKVSQDASIQPQVPPESRVPTGTLSATPPLEVRVIGVLEDFEEPDVPNVCCLKAPATWAAISKEIGGLVGEFTTTWKPDIVHFIGHGRFGDGKGQIALESEEEDEQADWIDAEGFMSLLENIPPRLVVLQACDSAQTGTGSGFLSLAAQLVAANIPAVVAMQFEIRNDTAADFASGFYDALKRGLDVDSAVQMGRSRIPQLSKMRWNSRQFGTPVLFMFGPYGIISPLTTRAVTRSDRGAGRERDLQTQVAGSGSVSTRTRQSTPEDLIRSLDEKATDAAMRGDQATMDKYAEAAAALRMEMLKTLTPAATAAKSNLQEAN